MLILSILHIRIGVVHPEGNLAIKMHIFYEQKNPISNLQKLWHKCIYVYKNNRSVVCSAASKRVGNNLPRGLEAPHRKGEARQHVCTWRAAFCCRLLCLLSKSWLVHDTQVGQNWMGHRDWKAHVHCVRSTRLWGQWEHQGPRHISVFSWLFWARGLATRDLQQLIWHSGWMLSFRFVLFCLSNGIRIYRRHGLAHPGQWVATRVQWPWVMIMYSESWLRCLLVAQAAASCSTGTQDDKVKNRESRDVSICLVISL